MGTGIEQKRFACCREKNKITSPASVENSLDSPEKGRNRGCPFSIERKR